MTIDEDFDRDEQRRADHTWEALSADSTGAADAVDPDDHTQTRRIGEAIRGSASADLPEPSASVREAVRERLESSAPVATEPSEPLKDRSQRRRRLTILAIAASLLLALGIGLAQPSGRAEIEPLTAVIDRSESISTETTSEPRDDFDQYNLAEGALAVELETTSGSHAAAGPVSISLEAEKLFGDEAAVTLAADVPQRVVVVSDGITVPVTSRPSMRTNALIPIVVQRENSYTVQVPATTQGRPIQRTRLLASSDVSDFSAPEIAVQTAGRTDELRFEYRRVELGWRVSVAGEQYDAITENGFIEAIGQHAVSTFSIDVDTASYSNMRRFLESGKLPPPNSIRIEELINYFKYDDDAPDGDDPFSVSMEVADCPWNGANKLLRIGLKGKEIHRAERPASNLVFLLDVSGSMSDANKLALMQRGLMMMLDQLQENDSVSIVTYAGNAGVRLQSTSGDQKRKIGDVIESLTSGGSTHGSAGIERAYELATENFIKGGTNRVILATDGDLNVGITDDDQLVRLIKAKAGDGVFLTVLGFGTGNLKDSKMEKLADNGNGVYAYIDSIREAHKVLVEQMSGSLVTIAKDVKLQLEFNPRKVKAYRLIGYENRMLAREDFDNDKIDAGEIGAGHSVTALYELVTDASQVAESKGPATAKLKYQDSLSEPEDDAGEAKTESKLSEAALSDELLSLSLRYKQPDSDQSKKIEFVCEDSDNEFVDASEDFRFAASVASLGMVLRDSQYRGTATAESTEAMAAGAVGEDPGGYRSELVDLVRKAGQLLGE